MSPDYTLATMSEHVWTDTQFEEMSWHDNHIHALRVVEGEHGAGELILDVDYIAEWLTVPDGGFRFKIIPAELRFFGVTDLKIEVDYKSCSAALGPLSVSGIERKTEQRLHYVANVWTLSLNWPSGEISFEAKGFAQKAVGSPVLSEQQLLKPHERENRG